MRVLRRLKSAVIFAFPIVAFLLLLCPSAAVQEASKDAAPKSSNAMAFLTEVFELYGQATSYHLEFSEERTLSSEFSRSWTKSLTTAIVAPGNKFRFEIHSDHGRGLQVSDGKTEWIYYPSYRQYTQHATPAEGPSRIQGPIPELYPLNGAQRTTRGLSGLLKFVRTAIYAPDEAIDVNRKSFACKVIKTEGDLPGASLPITTAFTFWIDKQTRVIRKMTQRREGPLSPTAPDVNFVAEEKIVFFVADLAPASLSDQTFTFEPPLTASLVEKFEDRMDAALREFVGKPAPDISFKTADGKDIPLKSFQGKPVLLDFWATSCAPCVDSLPAIEKLYQETAKNGLVLISIDQDEEAKTAEEFWRKHDEPWPNFHASTDMLGHFPQHGVPYFVLVDTSGMVVLSSAGADETALRAAIAKLGPAFASLSKLPSP